MLQVAVTWIYVTFLAFLYGNGINRILKKVLFRKEREQEISLSFTLFAGLAFFSVYGTVWSFFGSLGMEANAGLLLGAVILLICHRKRGLRGRIGKGAAAIVVLGFLVLSYFSSRGYEHYDTLLYHAQAIHYLEDYGTVKGLGNTYFRYAYNSSFFVLSALFSLRFVFGQSLHGMAGLFAWYLLIGVAEDFHPIRNFKEKKLYTADIIGVFALYYLTMIADEIVSPASDYSTMILVFYIFMKFARVLENAEGTEKMLQTGLLCVLSCFAFTLKTSAAPVVLLTLYPAVWLIRQKKGREIRGFLGMGLLIVVPYLLRGFWLSGYLLYPSTMLDVFSVDWKMAKEILDADTMEISAWGKGIENLEDWGMGFLQWFPIWLTRQKTWLEKVLTIGCVVLTPLLLAGSAIEGFGKKKRYDFLVLHLTIIVSFAFWLLMAPLPRYGWCYLFILPSCFAGLLVRLLSSEACNRILLCFLSVILLWKGVSAAKLGWLYKDYPNYLCQQDYSETEAKEIRIQGQTFYVPQGLFFGYENFPGVAENAAFEMRGDSIRDGFRRTGQDA